MKRLGAPASSPASSEQPMGTSAVPGLVPKLRFAEFDDDWLEVSIGDFFDLSQKAEKSAMFDIDKVLTVKLHTNGVIKSERSTLTGGANYFKRNAGQFIFSKIDLLNGAFGVVPAELDGFASSSDVPAFSFNDHHCSLFFLNWLKANYLRLDIERTGTSSTLKRISPSAFLALTLSTPTKAEQQKIAECLSTLDELISAASQKLDALKAHKKGLMQQLFPREGETLPRLRFPEFQDAPEWRPTKLSSEINLVSGMHLAPDQYSSAGEVPYFTGPSDFTNESGAVPKWTQRSMNVAQAADTLITVKGSGVGEVWYSTLPAVAMGRQLMAVRAKNGSSQFVYQFLLTKKARFADLGAGNLIPGLSRVDILEMEAHFPLPPEQHRIASCLSSLDDLIAAQSTRIDALKTHKQGLMQQLFPSPSDADL